MCNNYFVGEKRGWMMLRLKGTKIRAPVKTQGKLITGLQDSSCRMQDFFNLVSPDPGSPGLIFTGELIVSFLSADLTPHMASTA